LPYSKSQSPNTKAVPC